MSSLLINFLPTIIKSVNSILHLMEVLRIESHDRANCWTRNRQRNLTVAVLYTLNLQQVGRRAIEQELRSQYTPVCGIR